MILWIFSKKQNPNGSENVGHAKYWFKGLGANERESEITGFSGLHLLYHWERAPKMVQEVGLASLPAHLPPQVEEREVFEQLRKLKKTKSTFPIDLPEKL